ncbi:MAG: hypothetical protein Kow0069_34630 [Promethearchaeota archaeon]
MAAIAFDGSKFVPTSTPHEHPVVVVDDEREKFLYLWRNPEFPPLSKEASLALASKLGEEFPGRRVRLLDSLESSCEDGEAVSAFKRLSSSKASKSSLVGRLLRRLERPAGFTVGGRNRSWAFSYRNRVGLKGTTLATCAGAAFVVAVFVGLLVQLADPDLYLGATRSASEFAKWAATWLYAAAFTSLAVVAVNVLERLGKVDEPGIFSKLEGRIPRFEIVERPVGASLGKLKAPPLVGQVRPKMAPQKSVKPVARELKPLVVPPPRSKAGVPPTGQLEYASEEDEALGIPLPPPPKKLRALNAPQISARIYGDQKLTETEDVKPVLIDCKICKQNIVVPVPKRLVLDEKELPVVPVTFVHGEPKHALILHLDHDFQVRRRRVSAIVEQE